MVLDGGKLSADFREMALYGGNVTGKLTIATNGPAANVTLALKAHGCQTEPLLRDAMGYDKLSGAGDLTLSVTTRGASERDLVAGLDGKAAFELRNGVLRGINLAGMVTHVATAFQAGAGDKTEFSEVHGTFTLDAGVARNTDLVLKSPLMQIAGDGTVNLNARTMDYRISPKFVAPIVGQLGLGSPGVRVPVMVRGPWTQLRYEPDLAGLAMNVVDVPVDVLKGVIEIPGNLIGGKGGDEKKDDTKSRNPLKNLFGR